MPAPWRSHRRGHGSSTRQTAAKGPLGDPQDVRHTTFGDQDPGRKICLFGPGLTHQGELVRPWNMGERGRKYDVGPAVKVAAFRVARAGRFRRKAEPRLRDGPLCAVTVAIGRVDERGHRPRLGRHHKNLKRLDLARNFEG